VSCAHEGVLPQLLGRACKFPAGALTSPGAAQL